MRYPKGDLKSLTIMAGITFAASILFLVSFGLFAGYASEVAMNTYYFGYSGRTFYSFINSLNSNPGCVAGLILLIFSTLLIFAMGIVLILFRKLYFRDQALVTVFSVVSILGGLFVASAVLSLILISKIVDQRNEIIASTPAPAIKEPHSNSD